MVEGGGLMVDGGGLRVEAFHFPAKRIDIALAQFKQRGRVEAAVGATAFTKWNMYV